MSLEDYEIQPANTPLRPSVTFSFAGAPGPHENELENELRKAIAHLNNEISAKKFQMHQLLHDQRPPLACYSTSDTIEPLEDSPRDRFQRRVDDMPRELRRLYDEGRWKDGPVYLWDLSLSVCKEGHRLAAESDQAMDRLRAPADENLRGLRAENHPVVHQALDCVEKLAPQIADTIIKRRKEEERRKKALAKKYRCHRQDWLSSLQKMHEAESDEEKRRRKERDRYLLLASGVHTGKNGALAGLFNNSEGLSAARGGRGGAGSGTGGLNRLSPLALEQVDAIIREIDRNGGTHGGVARWSKSLATIPEQRREPPPAGDCGVLIEDPVAFHYEAQSINPWTKAERLLFLQKFLTYPKCFAKISKYFEHKSVYDVIRFYYDNKLRLGLKRLLKDSQHRKRAGKKEALLALSELPTESRSIRDNFYYQGVFEDQFWGTSFIQTEEMQIAARNWDWQERKRLVNALCRFRVLGPRGDRSWNSISEFVETKSPNQCAIYYEAFKTVLKLETFAPPRIPDRSHLWKGREIRLFMRLLRANGKRWDLIASEIGTKSRKQCKKYWKHHVRCRSPSFLRAIGLDVDFTLRPETVVRRALHNGKIVTPDGEPYNPDERRYSSTSSSEDERPRAISPQLLIADEEQIRPRSTTYMEAQPRRPQRRRRQQKRYRDDSDPSPSPKRTRNARSRPRPSQPVSSRYGDASRRRSGAGQVPSSRSPEGKIHPSQSGEPGPSRSQKAASSRRLTSTHGQARPSRVPQKRKVRHEEPQQEPPKRLRKKSGGSVSPTRAQAPKRARTQRKRVPRSTGRQSRTRARGSIGKINGEDIQPDMLPKLPALPDGDA